jgi:hypothetical protein
MGQRQGLNPELVRNMSESVTTRQHTSAMDYSLVTPALTCTRTLWVRSRRGRWNLARSRRRLSLAISGLDVPIRSSGIVCPQLMLAN